MAAALVLGVVTAEAAEGPRVAAITPGGGLVPGTVVEVRWDPVEGPADELELLLVLDGSGTAALRLTRSLPPRTTSWRWRVPALPARAARLVLRVGREGREVEGEAGPPFRILAPKVPLARLTARHGDLWAGGTGGPDPVRARGLAPVAAASWPSGGRGVGIEPGGHAVLSPRPVPFLVAPPRRGSCGRSRRRFPSRTAHGLPRLE